ncbi:MAG: type III pantothenate kinase [bacterium]|nr:type III pantothenate kinase [bacterium]
MKILALDIGNTKIHAAIFEGDKIIKKINTELKNYKKLKELKADFVAVASVVPQLNSKIKKIYKDAFFINYKNCGIKILYKKPYEVGADRLANVVGAYSLFKKPAIVVDFGTAITFDICGKKGEYLGGLILPGVDMCLKALYLMTAKLPLAKIKKTNINIAKTTQDAITTGTYNMIKYSIETITQKLLNKMPKNTITIKTGGNAKLFNIKNIKFNYPHITLFGVKKIAEKYIQI